MNKKYILFLLILAPSHFLYSERSYSHSSGYKNRNQSSDFSDLLAPRNASRTEVELEQLKRLDRMSKDSDSSPKIQKLASDSCQELLEGIRKDQKRGWDTVLSKAVMVDSEFRGGLVDAIASKMLEPVGKKLSEAGTAIVEGIWSSRALAGLWKQLGMKPLISSEELDFVKISAKSIKNILGPLQRASGKGGDDLTSLTMRDSSLFASVGLLEDGNLSSEKKSSDKEALCLGKEDAILQDSKQVMDKFPVKIMLTGIALDLENALSAFCKRLEKYKKHSFTPLGMAYKRIFSSLNNIRILKHIFNKAQAPRDLVKSEYYQQILSMSDSISESCDHLKPLLGIASGRDLSSKSDRYYSAGLGGFDSSDY